MVQRQNDRFTFSPKHRKVAGLNLRDQAVAPQIKPQANKQTP
jgi:hypothetical protein